MRPSEDQALKAIKHAVAGSNLLLRAAETGETNLAELAVANLLEATAIAMEQAGFDPDEAQRGQLYRAIADYTGDRP